MNAWIALIVALFCGQLSIASAAVTVTEITAEQAGLLKLNSVYHYTAQAGGTNAKESILSNNTTTVSADLTHSFPESLIIQHDDTTANVITTLGLTALDVPVLGSHNAIIIEVYNYNTFIKGASFSDITFNGVFVRNLFADLGPDYSSDRILVQFDSDEGYVLSGNVVFDEDFMTGSANRIEVWGVTNVPEPSVAILTVVIFLVGMFHRKR